MIRVLLADDHPMIRTSVARLLAGVTDMEVVGAACDGEEAVEQAVALRPDVVVLDLAMPRVDGVEATRRIVAAAPEVRVLVLTSYSDRDRILAALEAGAMGYLLKDASPEELIGGIRAARAGASRVSPQAAAALVWEQ